MAAWQAGRASNPVILVPDAPRVAYQNKDEYDLK